MRLGLRPRTAIVAVALLAILVWGYLHKPFPCNYAPELEPLLKSATSRKDELYQFAIMTPGASAPAKFDWHRSRVFRLKQSPKEVDDWLVHHLRASDGWNPPNRRNSYDYPNGSARKRNAQGQVLILDYKPSEGNHTEVQVTVLDEHFGPFRLWLYRQLGIAFQPL